MRTRSTNERRVTWEREQRRTPTIPQAGRDISDNDKSVVPGHRQRAYTTMGEAALEWHSALTTHYCHGVLELDEETVVRLGIPADSMESVYEDRSA